MAGTWPEADLAALAATDVLRGCIPEAYGGLGLDAVTMHLAYEQIARYSIATALILTQRDAAVSMIEPTDNPALKDRWLPALARNELFATVGISQLTTSRQFGRAAVQADEATGGWHLAGEVPWATGAAAADVIVVGGVTADGGQGLFAVETSQKGVHVQPPPTLVAMAATQTTAVTLQDVFVPEGSRCLGPAEGVLGLRRKGVPIGQAFLSLGLCQAAIDVMREIDDDRVDETASSSENELATLRNSVLQFCSGGHSPFVDGSQLRAETIDLAVRLSHVAVALHKGAALRSDHPAQRLAREAMFLLVWSCPTVVRDCTIDLLVPGYLTNG